MRSYPFRALIFSICTYKVVEIALPPNFKLQNIFGQKNLYDVITSLRTVLNLYICNIIYVNFKPYTVVSFQCRNNSFRFFLNSNMVPTKMFISSILH